MNLELLHRYRRVISDNRRQAGREAEEHCWGFYDSSFKSYDDTFERVLEKFGFTSITEVVNTLKKDRTAINGLDLCGTGSALEGLSLQKGLGVSLGYYDKMKLDHRERHGIDFISGDIFLQSMWNEIRTWTKRHGTFQIILCRPLAGFVLSENLYSPSTYYHILRNIWKVLDNNGVFISQVPKECNEFLPQLEEILKPHSALHHYAYPGNNGKLMLWKGNHAPIELPHKINARIPLDF